MTYREALAWLYSTQRFGIKLGLQNAERLFAALHATKPSACVIHVAGTNGKGSVCAMIDSIARAAGYGSGLYTSPHLITFRERIRIGGEMINEQAVADGLERIRQLTASWNPHPTFFEITTALALLYFQGHDLDVVVLETGLGGRLDATNAVGSNLAVITPISFDHQQWLGDTIEKIASEKAGIIKHERPVISAMQIPESEQVIRRRAMEMKAQLTMVRDRYLASRIGLAGAHQQHNAAVAAAATRAALAADRNAITAGLRDVRWPARFQHWDERTVIDGAHNPHAMIALRETWQASGSRAATVILGILRDKDAESICSILQPLAERVFLCPFESERAAKPDELALILERLGVDCRIHDNLPAALNEARGLPSPILITGSLHFAGQALAFLSGTPAAYEECAQ